MEMFPGDDDVSDRVSSRPITVSSSPKKHRVNFLAPGDDDDKIAQLMRRLEDLESSKEKLEICCKNNEDTLKRLQNHAETLRITMLKLVKKIDVQTGY